jgi:hypothetical protein
MLATPPCKCSCRTPKKTTKVGKSVSTEKPFAPVKVEANATWKYHELMAAGQAIWSERRNDGLRSKR